MPNNIFYVDNIYVIIGGAATISGGGALTSTGEKAGLSTVAISGNGALAATGTKEASGVAAISGGGTLTCTGIKHHEATISGGGSLTSVGTKTGLGEAILSGNGTLVGIGIKTGLGTVVISGNGTLAGVGTKQGFGEAIISGNGALTCTGVKVEYAFVFTQDEISVFSYIKNIDELRNHIMIEGEVYSDKYFKTVSGDNLLDDAITDSNIADGSIKDRHVKEIVTDLPYETQALVSLTKDTIVPFYLPSTMLALDYVYLNLYFPGLEDGDYPKNSPNIYLPTINASCLRCHWSFPDAYMFSMDTSGKIKAGTGAIDATHNYLWRSYIKFNVSMLAGFKLSSCDLKWALENIIRTGAGSNSQLSMILDALADFGDVDLGLWEEASAVAYGNVNAWNDLIGYSYSEDVKTRIQALADAEANNACFRFMGSDEPADGVNTINYILNNILLCTVLEEDTSAAVSIYADNGSGFGGSLGSYSTDQENLDLTAQFSGAGKKRLKFTCSRTRRIDVLIRIGLTINRP